MITRSLFVSSLLLLSAFVNGTVYAEEVPSSRRVITSDYRKPDDVTKIKVAFFDADNTLRVSKAGTVSANSVTDVLLLPYIGPTLRALAEDGYLLYIVSNQDGVKAGVVSFATADGALRETIRLIREEGGVMHGYDFAEDDVNRKPKSGMKDHLEAALQEKFGPTAKIDLGQSFMVGDSGYKKGLDTDARGNIGTHFSNGDRLFAETIGIEFREPSDFFGWREFGTDLFLKPEEVTAFMQKCLENPDCVQKLILPTDCGSLVRKKAKL